MTNIKRLFCLLGIFIYMVFAPSAIADNAYTFQKGVNISHWMAQHFEGKYADPWRFSESEAKWIAEHGFDHVRIPVDGRILLSVEGKLINELMEPFDRALIWAKKYHLGVILDMHYLPGSEFLKSAEENALWRDPQLQNVALSLWKQLAEKYLPYRDILRFEVMNEAVAPKHSDVNALNEKLVTAIRGIDKDRILYVTANEWGMFKNAEFVHVFKDDPNVQYVFHYYEPIIFTHQNAPWVPYLIDYYTKAVSFPDKLTDLDKYFPKGSPMLVFNNVELDAGFINNDFDRLGAWAKRNKVQVLISEFGVINRADADSARRWVAALTSAAERNGFGLTIWDYKGDFRVNDNGKPTANWEGLFESADKK